MKNSVLHKSDTRGVADFGWLNSKHTFSFSNYHNAERMNFGVLRVLNDDTVAAGMGFGIHPHSNMEIISIPLEGDLQHEDSMGNQTVIRKGDIQIMSAGTGVAHSEYNASKENEVKFLQIWVIPNKENITPSYDQITLDEATRKNNFQQIVSPVGKGSGVSIHQDAWFHLGAFDAGFQTTYNIQKTGNGVYVFVLKGSITVDGQQLDQRDGFGVWDIELLQIIATTDAEVLLMEVPMNNNY
jgi:hypothetical protein